MADPRGFLKHTRELPESRKPKTRVKDFKEIYKPFAEEKTVNQAARCMDCGVPFCHNGCPLGNIIPEFNDAVYRKSWEEATAILIATNNFPEFTGRICPAPCEEACVLGINQPPVTIEHIEKTIAETAFEKGYIRASPPAIRTDKKVAIVGSGPAGLAAAAQLNKAGHNVTVYERDDRIGGLLRYGIPDFKLEKWVIDRRQRLMEAEGVKFEVNAEVGGNVDALDLLEGNDALLLCGGSTVARDIPLEGRELSGIHFAMSFLKQNNKIQSGDNIAESNFISARDKHVVVIGGGDTGSDCVGTSNRHFAKSITQLEIMPMPPQERDTSTPWPMWSLKLRSSSSHEEGASRQWAVLTKAFVGDANGKLTGLKIVDIKWDKNPQTGRMEFVEIEGSERVMPCDLAFIAAGFLRPEHDGVLKKLNIDLNTNGTVADDSYRTNIEKVFTAGDMRRGQSLVVWALMEGREAARRIDEYLMGESVIEGKSVSYLQMA